MGRPRTGRVERRPTGTYFCRLLLEDGTTSSRIDLPEARSLDEARAMTKAMQVAEDRTKTLYAAALAERTHGKLGRAGSFSRPGTVDAWWELYIESKEVGSGHRRVEKSQWRKWISPTIGKLAMITLRPEDIERVRDRLDASIKASKIASGTAENIWSTLTTAMTAATNVKDRELRVHVPPHYTRPVHTGILPPNGGRDRARPFLYPSEWLAIASCHHVSASWRRTYALAAYTGLRPGELRVLTWDDIELDAGLVRVNKAWDAEERTTKETKTLGGHRLVPLRPEIRHLLARPPGVPGRGLVVAEGLRGAAPHLRADLRTAGVMRPRLFTRSATELPVDFRSLRDTYATWRALQGVEAYVLRREMGHESLETTDRYIRLASGVRDAAIGTPFPPFGAFLEGLSAGQDAAEIPPGVSPAVTSGAISPVVSNGSDCRTRTCESVGDLPRSREISDRDPSRTGEIGLVPPGFLPGPGDSLEGILPPFPPTPTTTREAEVALYDIVDRADLAALTRPEGDDP